MTKTEKLLAAFASAVKAGGGIHTAPELAYMLWGTIYANTHKVPRRLRKKGIVRRISNGIFESTLTPSDPNIADK